MGLQEPLSARQRSITDTRALYREQYLSLGTRFGNVVARGLDTVIVPNLGETNVIGMNLLSRLASWRVEGDTLVLVPNNPQPVEEWSGG